MKTVNELLREYRAGQQPAKGERLQFSGACGKDVYNITAPFDFAGKTLIAGRMEERDSEAAHIGFFEKVQDDCYQLVEGTVDLPLQDPFVTFIGGKLILGGVETYPHPEDATKLHWRTNFYEMKTLEEAGLLFKGPGGMKDLRLKELADGRLLVLTRPQGEKGGRGKIGVLYLSALEELSTEKIEQAPLAYGNFLADEWGGANEIYQLADGQIGVLGHIARFDEHGDRHYYPITFTLKDQALYDVKIIAERSNFAASPAKRPDLEDVVFSGGLHFLKDGTAYLYAGIADATGQRIKIKHPFE
ncbi:DUF1861 family protein [Listeria costaricensis]|uniref:DUF1861 family protein n=1 Tax=Listeria costaricensis TaxID=2026604 RepID=UPI000C06A25D|nr:DUF1861 family protein [Listeria costaricensis]